MRSNREYDYFGNVLEYEYDYFPSYSSMSTQKVFVLEYEYDYSISVCYTFVSGVYKNILLKDYSKVFIFIKLSCKLSCLKNILNVCLKNVLVALRAAKCV